jgi:predicted DNA-binding transcriptional regulator AlpA
MIEYDERLNIHDVMRIACRSRASIYKMMKKGIFPQQVKSEYEYSALWSKKQVLEWLESLKNKK